MALDLGVLQEIGDEVAIDASSFLRLEILGASWVLHGEKNDIETKLQLYNGKCLICDTKTDSLATRNHPPFYLRSDTKSDSFATHAPLGSIGGTGDRG